MSKGSNQNDYKGYQLKVMREGIKLY